MHWNEWHHPLTVLPSWYFQVWAMSENLAAAKMKAECLKMRKDVWTCTLFSLSQWGVYMGRQVMYYLVRSSFVLDQGLIERGCDWWFLSPCKNVCTGMKVNLWPPHRTRSIPAYIECKVREMYYTTLLACAWTGPVIRILTKQYSCALRYWTAVG